MYKCVLWFPTFDTKTFDLLVCTNLLESASVYFLAAEVLLEAACVGKWIFNSPCAITLCNSLLDAPPTNAKKLIILKPFHNMVNSCCDITYLLFICGIVHRQNFQCYVVLCCVVMDMTNLKPPT